MKTTFVIIFLLCISAFHLPEKNKLSDEERAEIMAYQLNTVDTLVDIGCNDGTFSKEIAIIYPNLFLILEDLAKYKLCAKGGSPCREISTASKVEKRFQSSKKYPDLSSRYTFVAGQADVIPLRSKGYQRILCRRTLHEFEEREKMVDELHRILSPNGILTIVEAQPMYRNQVDIFCNKKYLNKEEVLKIMKDFVLKELQSIKYDEGELTIYNFSKNVE